MNRRASGILLHVTSLPSPFGIGDLGPGAYRFTDFLARSGQSLWQVLPLNPTSAYHDYAPYSSISASAGNPLLVSPQRLVEEGFLELSDLAHGYEFPADRVRYRAAVEFKTRLLERTFERWLAGPADPDYRRFCSDHSVWLDDYALFAALRAYHGEAGWADWPAGVRDREPRALREWREKLAGEVERHRFYQYLFHRQWLDLKRHCNERGIHILGDMPIYVDYDSVDVWAHRNIFKLEDGIRPSVVAGVPPDYFSATGQLWGNPVYNWNALARSGYAWWVDRMAANLELYDMVRIDHFRGFIACWEVDPQEKTAIEGKWVHAPAVDFFRTLLKRFPYLPVVVEDLGYITADVREVVNLFGFPNMKVLLFAFGSDEPLHPYQPHTYSHNTVAYTGTHDTNTARGWYETEASPDDMRRLERYLGRPTSADRVHWDLVRLGMASVADTFIAPMQDITGVGSAGRMNVPSVGRANWRWRLTSDQLDHAPVDRLEELTRIYGRA
jgi:4-alpha-glucanotransferase